MYTSISERDDRDNNDANEEQTMYTSISERDDRDNNDASEENIMRPVEVSRLCGEDLGEFVSTDELSCPVHTDYTYAYRTDDGGFRVLKQTRGAFGFVSVYRLLRPVRPHGMTFTHTRARGAVENALRAGRRVLRFRNPNDFVAWLAAHPHHD